MKEPKIIELNIIQRSETNIAPGTDLVKHNYTFKEVCAIINEVIKYQKDKTNK